VPRQLAGLIAGAVAAIAASLLSLPLDSPDDAVLNTGTVTVGALIVGAAYGVLWTSLGARPARLLIYVSAAAAGLLVAVVCTVTGEQLLLDGMIGFVLPLAAIVFAVVAAIPPVLAAVALPRNVQLGGTAVALVAALGVGLGFAGMGDEESGRLSLPGPTSTPQAGEVITADDVDGHTFAVVPGESELTYTVREKRALLPGSSDAVGRTSQLSGEVRLDGGPSEVSVDLSTLQSDQDRRDNYIRENIFQTEPIAVFAVDGLGDLPSEYVPGTTITRTLSGRATVRGVEREVTFNIEARLEGGTLQVVGRIDFTWADFEITPPNIPGIVQVKDSVHIEVLVIARAETTGA